jgi:hypothetical protein
VKRDLSLIALFAFGLSCGTKDVPKPPMVPRQFDATRTDTRFHTAEHMRASLEMQVTGEPFAQLLGRDLAAFNRFSRTTDQYTDPATGQVHVDTLGYAFGVESYEYSKQPMNNLSFEAGAGLSLQFGPLLNPANVTGDAAYQLMLERLQHLADTAHASGLANFVSVGSQDPTLANFYGWPGFWPQIAEFRSFDPKLQVPTGATRGCTLDGGYAAASMGAQVVGNYECGYNGLNLPERDAQVDKVLEPNALGYAMWKQALWVINYWQSMHDLSGNPITDVSEADLPLVGMPGNTVVGKYADPANPGQMLDGDPGVYLGDITLEGWQGLVMLEEMDNKSALLLGRLSSEDGVVLGGFASTRAALDYDYTAPLRYWPSSVAVTEKATAPDPKLDKQFFPQPTSFAVAEAKSRLADLSALAGGAAAFFALSDFENPDVGGQASSRATFDGDPFPADNQLADGEPTPHDRALALLKVLLVNVDRLHFDAAHKVLVDTATVQGQNIQRGTTVDTVEAAYAIWGLRTALRSISHTLTLYSNDTPDTQGLATVLDSVPFAGAPAGARLRDRTLELIRAEADFLAKKLIDPEHGYAVANGYDLAADQRDSSSTRLESEAAAIRGLLEAYLATSDESYRQTAMRVYADLESRFWVSSLRVFRTTASIDARYTWTPARFGTLEGALRQYWKLVGRRPGQERNANELLDRMKRTFKLVVNGWDDANGDDGWYGDPLTDDLWKQECTGAGLQMGERALTGETARQSEGPDRDHDCVPEISAAQLPSALAAEIVLVKKP